MTLKEISDYYIYIINQYIFENTIFDKKIAPFAQELAKFPRWLAFSTTNLCNLKCKWCPNLLIKKKGTMPSILFYKIIDDFFINSPDKGFLKSGIWFGEFGEPLLDRNLIEYINFIRNRSKNISLNLFTNGLKLTEEVIESLLTNNVNIDISLDELDEKQYKLIKGIDLQPVYNNIINSCKLYSKYKPKSHFIIHFKTMKDKKHIINHELFKEIKQFDIKTRVSSMINTAMQNWAGALDRNKVSKQYSNKNPNHRYVKEKLNVPCIRLYTTMEINYNGLVHLCCKDIFGKIILGDLNTSSIAEIWADKTIASIRNLAKKRKRFSIPLCNKCDFLKSWKYLKKMV